MGLNANFIHDVAVRCRDLLIAAGYTFTMTDDRDVIKAYASLRHRRVPTRMRSVHKAPYSLPQHLVAGERNLLAKVQTGDDLWPHQSRKIGNTDAEDGMLNDYGIQHFHLGTSPDPNKPGLIQGTPELLFAVVSDDDFYAIGIFDHAAWSKQALLDIVQVNWPHLLEPFTVKGVKGLSHHYSEEEAAELRKNGINVIQQRPDGTIHMGMGGGISTDGKSMAATRDTLNLIDYVEELQSQVLAQIESEGLVSNSPNNMKVSLEWRNDAPYAVTVPAKFEFNLSDALRIPPL